MSVFTDSLVKVLRMYTFSVEFPNGRYSDILCLFLFSSIDSLTVVNMCEESFHLLSVDMAEINKQSIPIQ